MDSSPPAPRRGSLMRWWLTALALLATCKISSAADVAERAKVYIYDLPDIMNVVLTGGNDGVWRTWFKADIELHQWLSGHPMRTLDPCEADLFFLPVHAGQLVMNSWTWTPLDWSKYDTRHRWMGEVVTSALGRVKTAFPFWNASNGADHFLVATSNHGRCDVLPLVPLSEVGDMIVVSTRAQVGWWRPVHSARDGMREQQFQCFWFGHDLTIPAFFANGSMELPTPPQSTERDIAVLLRFNDNITHFGGIRKAVLEHFGSIEFKGGRVVLGNTSIEETDADMRRSIFCFAPPGVAQHTARFYRAIHHGCIPVTFFSDMDLPFARISGLDYTSFSLNLDLHRAPSNMHLVSALLEQYLAQPKKIAALQAGLAAAQHYFNWDRADPEGVQATIYSELSAVARNVTRRHERKNCDQLARVALEAHRVREENERYWQDPIAQNPYRHIDNETLVTGDLHLPEGVY